jgi:DNA replication and repair protein RecF
VRILQIGIRGFRNINALDLLPRAGLNGFWGPNGQGKTNILEAIFAALRGHSFRPYCDRNDWICDQSLAVEVALKLSDSRGFASELTLKHQGPKRWLHLLNEKKVRAQTLIERFPVVVFSPDDHTIIRQGPELRRQYFDELLCDISPGYFEAHTRYGQTLRQRNELLKRELPDDEKKRHLQPWAKLLAKQAFELIEIRHQFWPQFVSRLGFLSERLMADSLKKITIEYRWDMGPELSVDQIEQVLSVGLARDLGSGWTHRGPHRDDFSIHLDGLEARSKASQGQARLLALLLKWTHAEWLNEERQDAPIFLIDDFSSELDRTYRAKLLTLISQLKSQVFLTGTDANLVDLDPIIDYTNYKVKNGVANPA